MKKVILILNFAMSALFVTAQDDLSDTLKIDLDKDFKKDMVIFDRDNGVLIVKLSTQKFRPVKTKVLEFDPIVARIRPTKSGFEYSNNWMRAGYSCQFRYDVVQKQVKLIGMTRFEFGPANNNGSGESSVNMITNNYIGNWNYFDQRKEKLIALPTIKRKMTLPAVYFSNFSDDIISDYQERCAKLYYAAMKKVKAANGNNDK